MRRTLLVVSFLLAGLLLPAGLRADEDARPWSEQPFLGLGVRDTSDGLVASWISPGPLGGLGFESTSGIRRSDNIDLVNGKRVDASGLKTLVKALAPGDEVTIVYRRAPGANPEAAVPKGGEGGDVKTLHVRLGSRDDWAGTIGRGLGARTIPAPREGAFESEILDAASSVGVRRGREGVGGGLDALLPYLAKIQDDELDPNSLPAVVNAFRRPLSVDAVEADLFATLKSAAGGTPDSIAEATRAVLDLEDPSKTLRALAEKDPSALSPEESRALIARAGKALEGFQAEPGALDALEGLVEALRTSVYIYDDHAAEHVHAITRLAGKRVEGFLALALVLLRLGPPAWETQAASVADGDPLADVPEEVRAAVEGDVLWYGKDALGHLEVVGGSGKNRYDMSRLSAVYDVGGDDRYVYGPSASPTAMRLVVDLGGDDTYESEAAFAGPATAVMGLSWLDDRAGNDTYETKHAFGIGAGLLGLGVLLDRAGNDVYESFGEASGWGIGVGFYGAGFVVDQAGSDVYRGEMHVEGVGGPRGLGAVIDGAGNDLYEANGPHFGSEYGTPAVYAGLSQGFGMGIRGYAAGGVGAIVDLGGDDRYEAGEFSQAGGYFFGFGMLHDVSGNDLYYGNRYGQAFSAHQAVGVLVDDAGDDTYWSMTAASQAGTWDQSIGLLLDRGGNDAYRCDGLGQGGASMQAIALLIDLGGDDRYTGRGGAVQGQGGGNSYHYDQDKVFSFSALLDLGEGRDVYSSGRENDQTIATGKWNERSPHDSSLYGLFLDR